MADTLENPAQGQAAQTRHGDDAPITTSKTAQPDRELFAETVTINRPPQNSTPSGAIFAQPARRSWTMSSGSNVLDATRSHWVVKAPGGQDGRVGPRRSPRSVTGRI